MKVPGFIYRKLYLLMTLMLFAGISISHAQIIYKNIKPDIALNTDSASFNIDMNDDGIQDYNFLYAIYHSVKTQVPCIGHSFTTYKAGVQSFDSNEAYTVRFDSGEIIDSNDSAFIWYNGNRTTWALGQRVDEPDPFKSCVNTTSYSGYFEGYNTYLGVRFHVKGRIYFGWIRVFVTSTLSAENILGYAYNSIPGKPILAGEKNCTDPTVTINANGPLHFCAGDSVTLTANGTGYEYQWKQNGINIEGATAKKYTAKTAGDYKCKVTNTCGSIMSAGKTVSITCKENIDDALVENEKIISTDQLRIVPNPFSNSTTISFSTSQSQKISVSIFDMTGRLVKTIASAQMQAGTNQITWNAKDENGNTVSAGIYFLRIQTEDYSETKKLVVTE